MYADDVTGYCGNSFSAGSVVEPATDCSFQCAADATELCGAGNRLSVYVKNGTAVVSTSATGSSTSVTGTSTSVSISVSTPSATGFPAGYESLLYP